MNEAANLFADGEAYERLMGRWSRLVADEFLDWLDAPKGLRWLDVGCGNGAFTERLIARCVPTSVVAIDPSKEQLSYARARPGTQLARFQEGDAQALPFADRAFDAAAMALVITFVPDPAKAVAEMARVVRPGGWVATYMWDIPGGGLPFAPLHMATQSLGIALPMPHNAAVSRSDALVALWERAGLRSIETRVIRTPVRYADFDDFWDSTTLPVGPAGKAISAMMPSERERLRARLREQLVPDLDGTISHVTSANAVKGRVPA